MSWRKIFKIHFEKTVEVMSKKCQKHFRGNLLTGSFFGLFDFSIFPIILELKKDYMMYVGAFKYQFLKVSIRWFQLFQPFFMIIIEEIV